MTRWRPTMPSNCEGMKHDLPKGRSSDGCIHFEWKRFPVSDRAAYEALYMIGIKEGSFFWRTRRAPYCKYYREFHHRISGTWTRGEFPFLQEWWRIGCPKGVRRSNKPENLGGVVQFHGEKESE